MPFGLQNAGFTFQGMMDQILGNLPNCFVYLDNVLISSTDLKCTSIMFTKFLTYFVFIVWASTQISVFSGLQSLTTWE